MKKMQHIEEIKDYWNLRANGFSLAVEEELRTESGKEWEEIFRKTITKEKAAVLDDGTGGNPAAFGIVRHQGKLYCRGGLYAGKFSEDSGSRSEYFVLSGTL